MTTRITRDVSPRNFDGAYTLLDTALGYKGIDTPAA